MYKGQTVFLGTKHGKEEALGPLLSSVGIHCAVSLIDTDRFGNFSGEVSRVGSVKETLRKKIQAVQEQNPEASLIIASEGSFGPHPFLPFGNANHEALLFFDKLKKLEIYVDDLTVETNLNERIFRTDEWGEVEFFLTQVGFPFHAVMLKGQFETTFTHKRISSMIELEYLFFKLSKEGNQHIVIATDMRACFNPTRMKQIKKVGEKLLQALESFCPSCGSPGFIINEFVSGLRCSHCELPTNEILAHKLSCPLCAHSEVKNLGESASLADPAQCPYCNP